MARPTKSKEPKPKAEGGGDGSGNALGGFKGILANAALTIVLMAIFVGINYFMVNSIIGSLGPKNEAANEHGEENGEEAVMTFPYDLDDFLINLSNPGEKRYLKVKVSLDITRSKEEPAVGAEAGEGHAGGLAKENEVKGKAGEGGAGQHGGPAPVDPKEYYNKVMEPFKMPIRDVIITTLSSMTAEELSSTTGKTMAKDRIKEEVNTILPENRQVTRVNFGDFIIQ